MKQNKPTYEEILAKLTETEKALAGAGEKLDAAIKQRDKAQESVKDIKAAYLKSESNFKNSVDACPLGIRIVTAEGDTIYANKAILDILGFQTVDDLIGTPRKETYTPDSYAEHLKRKEKRKRGEHVPTEYEIKVRSTNGDIRNLQVYRREIVWGGEPRFMVMYEDVTERKHVEEQLVDEMTKRRMLIEQSRDGIVILDQNGKVYDVNLKFAEMLGYTRQEAMRLSVWDWEYQFPPEQVLEMIRTVNEAGDHFETRHKRKDGSIYDVEISTNGAMFSGQKLIFCVCRDITELKNAQRSLIESGKFLDSIIEKTPNPMWVSDEKGTVIRMNQALRDLFQITDEEIVGKYNVLKDEQIKEQGFMPLVESVFKEGKTANFQLKYKTGDVRQVKLTHDVSRALEIIISAIKNDEGAITYAICIEKDITEQQMAQEAIKSLSARQQAILSAVPDIIMEVDNNKVYTWANRAGYEFFGNDVIGKKADYYFEGEQDTYSAVKPIFNGSENIIYIESWQRNRKGEKRLLAWWCRTLKDSNGNVTGALSSAQDITEMKQAEAALSESEAKYRYVYDNSNEAILLTEPGGGVLAANPAATRMFGRSEKEIIKGGRKGIIDVTDPRLAPALKRRAETGEFSGELTLLRADGTKFPGELFSKLFVDKDGNPRSSMIIHDITERKKAEKAIYESEERFRRIFQEGPMAIVLSSLDYRFTMMNPRFCQMMAYNEEELRKMTFKDLSFPEDIAKDQPNLEKLAKGKIKYYNTEKRYIRKDKEVIWGSLTVAMLRDNEGKAQGFLAMLEDITERKQAEEALKNSQEMFAKAFRSSPDAVTITTLDTAIILNSNEAAVRNTGYSMEELIGHSVLDLNLWADLEERKKMYHLLKENGRVAREEFHFRVKSGEIRTWEFSAEQIVVDGKDCIISVQKDVTEQKQAEQRIKESEEKFSKAFRASPTLMTVVTLGEARILDVNEAYCHTIGYEREELIEHTPLELNLWVDREQGDKFNQELAEKGRVAGLPEQIRTKTGEIHDFLTSGEIIALRGTPCMVMVAVDVTDRLKLEKELNRQYQETRQIIDASPVLVFYKDKDGKFLRVNKAFAEAINLPEEEFVGKTVFDLYSKEIARGMDKDDREVINSGQPKLNIEEQYESARGLRWVMTDKVPIFDSAGKITGLIGFAQDITERKEAEEALKESEERWRSIFNNSPVGIGVSDMDGTVISANKEMQTIIGYSANEFPALNLADTFVEGKDRERLINSVSQNGIVSDFETKLIRKDGTIYDALLSVTMIHSGDKSYYLTTCIDITGRKEAEARINHLNLTLRSIRNVNQLITREKDRDALIKGICDSLVESHSFESAWIVLVDENKKPVSWATARVQGNSQALFDMFRDGKIPICAQQAIKTEEVIINADPHVSCQDCPLPGSETHLGSLTMRLASEGKIYGVLCASMERNLLSDNDQIDLFKEVVTDIAFALRDIELGAIAAVLEQEQLRGVKLESIGTLAGGIAHDFNNLLAGIMGNIGLVKTSISEKDSERVQEMLDEAEKAATRARDLTRQLLTFAKGGAPVKKLVNIAELIREAAVFALRGSKVKLQLELPDNLWSVEADEGQLNQVINNLVINADEAMPTGGILRVSAVNLSLRTGGSLPISSGRWVKISVKDSGVGMSQEHLDRIFEPYFTTKQRGSGLGLTTAYSVVRNHGGHIFVESKLNVGSTFDIYLPAAKKTAKGRKKMNMANKGQAGGKVLVMDDEEIIRKMLKSMLSLAGYEVQLTSDGQEALDAYSKAMAANDPFTAVIMDLTIPGGMGGKEAISKLVEIDPEATVIVSSGYATDPIMSEYKKYGFKAVIAKPYSVQQLRETLSSLPHRKTPKTGP